MPFSINEDIEVLKLVSDSKVTQKDLHDFPPEIANYVMENHLEGGR